MKLVEAACSQSSDVWSKCQLTVNHHTKQRDLIEELDVLAVKQYRVHSDLRQLLVRSSAQKLFVYVQLQSIGFHSAVNLIDVSCYISDDSGRETAGEWMYS